MRVFVALACPPALSAAVLRYQELLKGVPDIRLLDEEGLHATVIPPWDERDPDAVIRDFAAIDSGPLTLRFDQATVRNESRPDKPGGLLWLGADATPETERLWLQAWRALWSQDPPRPPLPHVTVARFPDPSRLPELPPLDPLEVTLDRLCLYESQGDLRYRIVGERLLG